MVHALYDQLLLLLFESPVLQARRIERLLEPYHLRLECAPIGGGDPTLKCAPFLHLLELGGERIELRLPPVELEVTRMHLWGREGRRGEHLHAGARGHAHAPVGKGGAVVSTCMLELEVTRMHLARPRATDVGHAALEGADRTGPSEVSTLELNEE